MAVDRAAGDCHAEQNRLPVKRKMRTFPKSNCLCLAVVGIVGVFSVFAKPPDPEQAMQRFVAMFTAQDAPGVMKVVHPDILGEKEIRTNDVEKFLKRFPSNSLRLKSSRIEQRMKSEDGKTERFKASLVFRGPVLAPQYPTPSTLSMTLLWVLEKDKWWLERPLSIKYSVASNESFPTRSQQDAANQFEAALGVLARLGLKSDRDFPGLAHRKPGTAVAQYKELERLYRQERGSKGIDPSARGVDELLKAAAMAKGGFTELYHGDFVVDQDSRRKPVPWAMFSDYVAAATERGKTLEKQGNFKRAERIYRSIITLGQQFLDEAACFSLVNWGLKLQKHGAQELARTIPSTRKEQKQRVLAFANLSSRRLDSLQTAFSCLDDMTDYKSLQASIIAAERADDIIFRPWGINTLAILAFRGAPANKEARKAAGGMVLIANPSMQKTASRKLDEIAAKGSPKIKSFIEAQRAWVHDHKIYREAQGFR